MFLSCYVVIFYVVSYTYSDLIVPQHENIRYEPTWDSLDARKLPTWYDEAKFGIFIHWGVYAVPGLGEWFWYNWKNYKSEYAVKFMTNNFKPNFTYHEFAKEFTAEFFDPDEWATLFENAGAKYVVLTSKHHEGYALWPTKYSFGWNSIDVGPHRDIVGELAVSIRKKNDIKFGLYHSLYEWYNPIYLNDKKNNFTTFDFVNFKVMPQLTELVYEYKPSIIWSDGEWETKDTYWKSKEFLAWLYNDSPVKDTVVVNDRWGSETLCKHGGFLTCKDRYNPELLQNRKWENCMTIDKFTWGFRKNANIEDFLSTTELLQFLISTVSRNGNLLLNVAPTSYGKIPPIFQERLLDIGKWLSVNGEGIYSTTPWKHCQNDSLTPDVWYTTKKNTLYATFFNWPSNDAVFLGCVKMPENGTIELLGNDQHLLWIKLESNGTTAVQLPLKSRVRTDWAWMLKIEPFHF